VLAAIVVLFDIRLVDEPNVRRILAMGRNELWVTLLTSAIVIGVSVQHVIIVAMALLSISRVL